ncbi:unnamed protein product [Closterium sp. Yama58-4]|nr:unnamed protein product [Closterium sp. Yama58-4]
MGARSAIESMHGPVGPILGPPLSAQELESSTPIMAAPTPVPGAHITPVVRTGSPPIKRTQSNSSLAAAEDSAAVAFDLGTPDEGSPDFVAPDLDPIVKAMRTLASSTSTAPAAGSREAGLEAGTDKVTATTGTEEASVPSTPLTPPDLKMKGQVEQSDAETVASSAATAGDVPDAGDILYEILTTLAEGYDPQTAPGARRLLQSTLELP